MTYISTQEIKNPMKFLGNQIPNAKKTKNTAFTNKIYTFEDTKKTRIWNARIELKYFSARLVRAELGCISTVSNEHRWVEHSTRDGSSCKINTSASWVLAKASSTLSPRCSQWDKGPISYSNKLVINTFFIVFFLSFFVSLLHSSIFVLDYPWIHLSITLFTWLLNKIQYKAKAENRIKLV